MNLRKASDPYINHFAQADTLIPGAGSSQAWDRYAYVNNNPMRYNDPTGHMCSDPEDESSPTCDSGNHGGGLSPAPAVVNSPSSGPGDNWYKDDRYPILTNRYSNGNEDPNELEALAQFAKYGKFTIELLVWLGDYGKPAYKQLKGLGNAGPIVEGVAGGVLQAAQDLDDPSLSTSDKIGRAVLIGFEDGLTDMASSPVAAKGGVIGAGLGIEGGPIGIVAGGVAGYVAGNYLATQTIDNLFWAPINSLTGLFP